MDRSDRKLNLAPFARLRLQSDRASATLLSPAVSKMRPGTALRTSEGVLNLPSMNGVGGLSRFALTMGSNPVPQG